MDWSWVTDKGLFSPCLYKLAAPRLKRAKREIVESVRSAVPSIPHVRLSWNRHACTNTAASSLLLRPLSHMSVWGTKPAREQYQLCKVKYFMNSFLNFSLKAPQGQFLAERWSYCKCSTEKHVFGFKRHEKLKFDSQCAWIMSPNALVQNSCKYHSEQ